MYFLLMDFVPKNLLGQLKSNHTHWCDSTCNFQENPLESDQFVTHWLFWSIAEVVIKTVVKNCNVGVMMMIIIMIIKIIIIIIIIVTWNETNIINTKFP